MRYLKSFLKYFLLQTIYISLICFESLFNQPSTKQNKKSHSRSISLAFVKIEVSWIKLKIVFNQLVHLTISSSSSLNLNRFSLIFQSFIFIFYLSLKIERKLIWGLIVKKKLKIISKVCQNLGTSFYIIDRLTSLSLPIFNNPTTQTLLYSLPNTPTPTPTSIFIPSPTPLPSITSSALIPLNPSTLSSTSVCNLSLSILEQSSTVFDLRFFFRFWSVFLGGRVVW